MANGFLCAQPRLLHQLYCVLRDGRASVRAGPVAGGVPPWLLGCHRVLRLGRSHGQRPLGGLARKGVRASGVSSLRGWAPGVLDLLIGPVVDTRGSDCLDANIRRDVG